MVMPNLKQSVAAGMLLAAVVLFRCTESDDTGPGSTTGEPSGGASTADNPDGGLPDGTANGGGGGVADSGTGPTDDAGEVDDAGDPGPVDAGEVDDAGDSGSPVDAGEVDDAGADTGVVVDAAAPWPDDESISIDEVYQRLQNDDPEMLLINVVDAQFYDLGYIEGSLTIPWDTLADNLDQVDPEMHIVLYCRRGVRSESAYDTLTANGYQLVWVMEGGLEAWIAEGYPTLSY
jgi:rhodanese-related sulfurtransferase